MGLKEYYFCLPSGGATGTPCLYGSRTNVTGNASSMSATENITGAANAVVTIQVTGYTSSNTNGIVRVNSNQVFLNTTFSVTLDATGNGNFNVAISGDPSQTNTAVRVIFTIQSVTTGQIGSPNIMQESKTF